MRIHQVPFLAFSYVCYAFALCVLAPSMTSAQSAQGSQILVFSKTSGFRHGSIADGLALIQSLGVAHGFTVDATEDAADFTPTNLDNFDAVIWLSTTGDVLNASQESAFEGYIQSGGGYVGVHAATDTEYGWPWYGGLLGGDAWFQNHPSIQEATLDVVDATQTSTAHLPSSFAFTDEWYNFQNDPSALVNVLLTIDETTYNGGTMGASHPISWQHEYDGGRAWYTAMGHRTQTFEDPDFQQHLMGGIEFAVPEPSLPLMLLVGSLSLGLSRSKRKVRVRLPLRNDPDSYPLVRSFRAPANELARNG